MHGGTPNPVPKPFQVPLGKRPSARAKTLNHHAKALASGNPFLHQAASENLAQMKLSPAEHQHVQRQTQKYQGTGVPSPSVSAVPKGYKTGKKIDLGPQPLLGFKPKHIERQQRQLGKVKKGIAKENADYARIVNPLSHEKLVAAVEGLTGYHEIRHIANHPLAGGLALAGLLPVGRVGKVIEEAGVAAEAARSASKTEKGFRASRQAIKAARRGERMTREAAHAHALDLAKQAAERPDVQRAMHRPNIKILKPGEVTTETGGEAGAKLRKGMNPDFSAMGTYEKVGAKLDNPGLKELRKQQDELRAAGRSKRAGSLRAAQQAALKADNPVKAMSEARGVLSGKLPAKVFKGFDTLTHEDQVNLLHHINAADLRPHEKDNLWHAIQDGIEGKVPTEGEQHLIERAFGIEKVDIATAIKTGGFKKAILDVLNIPRAFKAAGDMSWGLRQGLGGLAHSPKLWFRTFRGMFKPAVSEVEAQARMAAIHDHPLYPLAVHFGVPITDLGSAERGAADISQKEEQIMTNYAEHLHEMPGIKNVPVLKQVAKGTSAVIRASDRAYVVPLNELRMEMFSQLVHQAIENGWKMDMNSKLGHDLGGLVGALTGRGNFPKWLQAHRATINALFFSPGLMASRINMLNPAWYARMEPFARQQAFKAAGTLATTLSMVLIAARMAGAKVEMDPRNSDFGKIRLGNTRLDIAGGYSQYLTLLSRVGTGTSISSTTGKKTKLSGKSFGTSDWDIIQNFFVNKLAPVPSEGVTLAKGSRFGQPITPSGEAGQLFSPLLWNDMYQLSKAKGPGGGPGMAAATFLPDLFGVGVNNYAPQKKKAKKSGGPGGASFGGGGSFGGSSFGGSTFGG